MEFLQASHRHLDRICCITDQAKRQLHDLGLSQWQNGYPSRQVWEADIDEHRAYIAVERDIVIGVFAFQTAPDASYAVIDGHWQTDGAYASMHRVCVADGCKGRGVAGKMFAFGAHMAYELGFPSIRIDTHPGNVPMRKALAKAGFQMCGEVRLAEGCEKGDLRVAFEKVLDAR